MAGTADGAFSAFDEDPRPQVPPVERRSPAPGVRVEDVRVYRDLHTPDWRVVCASIALPELIPSDVVVEYTLEDADGGVVGSAPRRMWSEHAHGRGRFMFVARLSPPELHQAHRITVCVTLNAAKAALFDPTPVRATIPLRAD